MELNEVIIGRKVKYAPFENCNSSLIEEGIITSCNNKYVFVRYGNDIHSKATNPNDIEYI